VIIGPYTIAGPASISIPLASDYHWHARQGTLFSKLYRHTTKRCARVLLMPNTVPGFGLRGPIADENDLERYYAIVHKRLAPCKALMTIKLLPTTTPETILRCHRWGAVAAKLYPFAKSRPDQATTNAHDGIPVEWLEVERYKDGLEAGGSKGRLQAPNQNFLDVLGQMEKLDMVLCLHGEMPNYDAYTGDHTLTAVGAFLDFVDYLVYSYPRLRIVLEHISTAAEVNLVKQWYNMRNGRLVATVTPHHTEHTVNKVVTSPYAYCRPPAQYYFDRDALADFITSGHPAAVCGTDSAAHPKSKKECAEPCAGIFNAPVFLEYFTGLFEQRNALNHLAAFLVKNGDDFYEQKPLEQFVRLYRRPWTVPLQYQGLRPFKAGETLTWSMV